MNPSSILRFCSILYSLMHLGDAFTANRPSVKLCELAARRNRKSSGNDSMNSWYDDVDDDASPKQVFWEEIERQRLINQVESPDESTIPAAGTGSSTDTVGGSMNGQTLNSIDLAEKMEYERRVQALIKPNPTIEQIKAAEATLSQYELYQVADNWLDEDLQQRMSAPLPSQESLNSDENALRIQDQDTVDWNEEEVWDAWNREQTEPPRDPSMANVRKVPHPTPGKIFLVERRHKAFFA